MEIKKGLLRTEDLVEFFDVTRMTICNWRKAGLPFIRFGAKSVRYKLGDLEKWFGASFEELERYID